MVITDEEEQAALADGTSENAVDGVNYDETDVNTDIDQAQVITKDENNSATVYIDTAAIEELVLGVPTITEAIENLSEILDIPEPISPETKEVLNNLGLEGIDDFEDLQEALNNATCTEVSANNFWNFNWVLGSAAYAEAEARCSFEYDGKTWDITPKTLLECGFATSLILYVHYNRNLNQPNAEDVVLDMDVLNDPSISLDQKQKQVTEMFEQYGIAIDNFEDVRFYTAEESKAHGEGNTKLGVGDWEFVFDSEGNFVEDPVYVGTYNFVSYQGTAATWVGHAATDVIIWIAYGNTPDDPSTVGERLAMLTAPTAEEIAEQERLEAEGIENMNQYTEDISGNLCVTC